MNVLDMRTVLLSYLISSALCALVMFSLWRQNRRQPGISFWMADFVLQFAGLLLVMLRGAIPDFFSFVVANLFIVGGTLLLLIGLERYTNSVSSQRYNYIYLAGFVGVQTYFAFVQPSLQVRNINISLGLAVFCCQGAWLLLRRVDAETRQDARSVGYMLAGLTLFSIVRVLVALAIPVGSDFFQSGLYETLIILTYQMLYISLTFTLVLIVNRRLQQNLKDELAEQERTEQALRLSEEKFATAFRTSPYAITLTRAADGKVIDVNHAFVAMTGVSRAEALSSTTIALSLWADPAQRAQVVAALGAGKPVVGWEAVFRRKHGELFSGSISSQIIQLGDTPVIFSSIEDITGRKQAEEAQRASEERFRSLFQNSPIGLFHSLPEGRFLRVNPALAAMLGYGSPEEMVAAVTSIGAQVFVDPEQRASIVAVIMNQDIWFTGEVLLRRKEGSRIIADLAGRRVLGADGNIAYLEGFVQDITERRQAAEQLTQAKEAAEAANHAKSQFLANMSHELRTPLNAILGFSELMVQDANLTTDQQENLAIINRSGDHLLGLINDVLDMAKIEAGHMVLQEHVFDLHQLLDELTELFRLRTAEKELQLAVTRPPDLPRWVQTDEGKLRQVLINLLGNAVKFTSAGRIELTVQRQGPVAPGVRLRFVVEDTGPGIAPAELVRIFDPFVQASSHYALHEGTGLGLPISRHFARLMGGDLTARSTGIPGEGSRFQLEIAVEVAAASGQVGTFAPDESVRAVSLAAGQPEYRLLVVDDRSESRRLLTQLLTDLGFAVRTAENGQEAIQVWAEWQPQLIWMDMRMPVMDGHEATRRIKATAQGQATVVIAVTASAFDEQRAQILAEGCDDFVRKPFRAEEIVSRLVKHLGVRMIYAEGTAADALTAAGGDLPAAFDLTRLPSGWIEQTQQAAVMADAERLRQLAAAVADDQPALATALLAYIHDFDYASILCVVGRLQHG